MSKTNDILKEAISLPPAERAVLIDKLLGSLDEHDNEIDAFNKYNITLNNYLNEKRKN